MSQIEIVFRSIGTVSSQLL